MSSSSWFLSEASIADAAATNTPPMKATTLHEAFHTVLITRNTFVHSPALCYHFEDVLATIMSAVFSPKEANGPAKPHLLHARPLMLEFVVNQLLHTPLVGGDGLDESAREAAAAHDATRRDACALFAL